MCYYNFKNRFSIKDFQPNINQNAQQQSTKKKIPKFDIKEKHNLNFPLFCITGPALPYALDHSAMAESPDGIGVLLFGGSSGGNSYEDRILELRAGANSWNILDITLENGRTGHQMSS